jgi:hypothetical protein
MEKGPGSFRQAKKLNGARKKLRQKLISLASDVAAINCPISRSSVRSRVIYKMDEFIRTFYTGIINKGFGSRINQTECET